MIRSIDSMTAPHLTIFDLEFTAWEGSLARQWLGPGEFKEVVQIGAVRLNLHSLELEDSFDCLVRPRVNSVLSDYVENLTGISNRRLAADGGRRRFKPASMQARCIICAPRPQPTAMTDRSSWRR